MSASSYNALRPSSLRATWRATCAPSRPISRTSRAQDPENFTIGKCKKDNRRFPSALVTLSLHYHLSSIITHAVAQTNWGKTEYKGEPWVRNASLPYPIDHGLAGPPSRPLGQPRPLLRPAEVTMALAASEALRHHRGPLHADHRRALPHPDARECRCRGVHAP